MPPTLCIYVYIVYACRVVMGIDRVVQCGDGEAKRRGGAWCGTVRCVSVVLCCAELCCAVLCCAVVWRGVLYCVVLRQETAKCCGVCARLSDFPR